ncbi:hypothetical protein ACIRLA_00555 [Streptomyces sp. NPDC102364]|uniref:hypothetical protein n=1 Tax=Streptomyces sp. NPDC102364 TaxID=3366161 RepID=UPI003804139B
MKPIFFPDHPSFWYETLRTLGHIAYGGADFGEVATTAQGIADGDYDSWHDQWLATAHRIADQARTSPEGGHDTSARDGFLHASNYYRCAEFFLHGNAADPRIRRAYDSRRRRPHRGHRRPVSRWRRSPKRTTASTPEAAAAPWSPSPQRSG